MDYLVKISLDGYHKDTQILLMIKKREFKISNETNVYNNYRLCFEFPQRHKSIKIQYTNINNSHTIVKEQMLLTRIETI